MQTKVTLKLESKLIEVIERLASTQHLTLSQFTEALYFNYVKSSSPKEDSDDTQENNNILTSDNIASKSEILDYLTQHYNT